MRGACILLALAAAANAQVIRTGTQVVLVDVAVTDKKGAYPADLAASEFHVFEDGKEQKITGVTRAGESPQGRGRYTVLLFDNSSMSPREQAWAHQVAANFIDASVDANAMMAVVHFSGVLRVGQTFTDNFTRLKQAVGAAPISAANPAEDAGTATGRAAADFTTRRNLRSLENLIRNLETVPGRKSLVYFTPGFPISSGFAAQLRSVAEAANRSNVAVYPVNVRLVEMTSTADSPALPAATPAARGRIAPGAASAAMLRGAPADFGPEPGNPQLDAAARMAVLQRLAEDSGGFVVRQPDDTAALRRIVQEQREYYLLSYTPAPDSAGKCHKLRVRVDRKDTEWRARSEYCNTQPGDWLSGNPVERALEARAEADDAGDIGAAMQAAYFHAGPNAVRALVAMELDLSGIAFRREDGKFRAALDILGIARREEGGVSARFSDTVKLEFDTQAQAEEFQRAPYRYENFFDIAPGEYTLVVVASAGENFARLEEPLKIAPRQPREFGVSGLAMSAVFGDANNAADAVLDELLVDNRKRLVAGGVELILAGSRKLDAAKPAGVFFEIYEPLLADVDARENLAVAIQLRVLDKFTARVHRDTGLMRVDLAGQGLNPVIALGQFMPIQELSAGEYVLELQAIDSAGNFAKRSAGFEIE
jgi:VWFA-related protein